MDMVSTFGRAVGSMAASQPRRARRLLLAGYAAQQLMLDHHGNGALPASRNYVASLTMGRVRQALRHPERAAAVSLFVPCEPLEVAGVTPYSVELLSAFLAGTRCEQDFLRVADDAGFSDTLCSYHRTFLGAFESGLLPAPAFAVYTNLACDGNMVSFPHLVERAGIPGFFVDVPYERSAASVSLVADELRHMVAFVEEVTGTHVSERALSERVAADGRTAESYRRFVDGQAARRLPSDMTSEMYAVIVNHILLGTPEAERFAGMLEREMRTEAEPSEGLRLVWMHLIPNMLAPVTGRLSFSDDAYVTACDLATDPLEVDFDPERPYESMARRLVYSAFNGNIDLRVSRALDLAERTRADGAVLFAHWGCKATLGAANIIKDRLEGAGLPCLVLDGDGCDRANSSEGQVATRLGAYLEMLSRARGTQARAAEVAP